MSRILEMDAMMRRGLRVAHAQDEAFDDTVEEKPRSQVALDTLWADGRGYLSRVQFEAGDWLRKLYGGGDGRETSHIKVHVDFGNTPDLGAASAIDRDAAAEGALYVAARASGKSYARELLEWVCKYEYALSDIARRLGTKEGVAKFHHETAKRRIADVLEHLADYKFGIDRDREEWNRKAKLVLSVVA